MPELPDIVVYIQQLESRILGSRVDRIRLASPFLLRSVTPPLPEAEGKRVLEIRRLGKRIVIGLEDNLFLVFHLMISGRLHWRERGVKAPARRGLATFDFTSGTLSLTEAGSKKRASLHVVKGEQALKEHDPGGIEVLETVIDTFRSILMKENHTLKRVLTDPRLFSGIGNAYSDEILFRARLSPAKLTRKLVDEEVRRLHDASQKVLREWTMKLKLEAGNGFPEKVTAFRAGMAVHGRYRQPCPECGSPIQRIVYAESEANYCAHCQTAGKLLVDRALSKLLHDDWPRTIEALEARKASTLSPTRSLLQEH
jgi:formamidopyrimidine-DNA glycosylase